MIPEDFWTTINPIPRSITELAIERVQEDALRRYANALKEYCLDRECEGCCFHKDFSCIVRYPADWDLEESK